MTGSPAAGMDRSARVACAQTERHARALSRGKGVREPGFRRRTTLAMSGPCQAILARAGEGLLQRQPAGWRMSDVFVSYRSDDRQKVGVLVEALRAEGLDVWWDQDIPANAVWAEAIAAALAQAKAVVVCWSQSSVASENVREEARRARARGLLVQAYVEDCEPPLFFGEQQGARLVNWTGARDNDRFQMLVAGLRAIIAGKPLPPTLRKQIGYKARERLAGPLLVLGFAILVAASAAVLFIREIREVIFPPPPIEWSMSTGARVDIRPALPPDSPPIDRFASPVLIAMSPAFLPSREPREAASVSELNLELDVPGQGVTPFHWLYFTRNDDYSTQYIDVLGDAAPFPIDAASAREITFEPAAAYKWSDFVRQLNDALGAGEETFTVRVRATLAVEGETVTLTELCHPPIAPVLERMQRERLALDWIVISCDFPVPMRAEAPAAETAVAPAPDSGAPSAANGE